jgi:eight-cysteine-cluster-containing protein
MQRIISVPAPLLAVLTLVLVACAPGQVPPTPTDRCVQDGKVYQPGDTFPSSDGCNSCSCTVNGQIACTLKACVDAGASGCFYQGKRYEVGQSFPAADGCNTCNCGSGGVVGCTKIGCPTPAACKRGGCSGQICAAEDVVTTCEWRPEYACYKSAACERQANGQCGFTKTPELERCLAGSK